MSEAQLAITLAHCHRAVRRHLWRTKVCSLVKATGTAANFDAARQQTIGLLKGLYESAAPYVLKSYQRVQKIFRG